MIKEEWGRYKKMIQEALQDLKTKGRRKYQIPNILTSTRLLAPFLILPAAFCANLPLLIGFIVLFSATDLVDGFIARTFHFTSELGKDLDAFCDKLFAGTLLLANSFAHPILLFNLLLEGIIASINTQAKLKQQDPKSLFVGKIKTGFLFPLIGLGLISSYVPSWLFYSVFACTCSLQVITAVSYKRKYKRIEENATKKMVVQETMQPELDDEEEQKVHSLGELGPSEFLPTMIHKREERLDTLRELRKIIYSEVIGDTVYKENKQKKYTKNMKKEENQ